MLTQALTSSITPTNYHSTTPYRHASRTHQDGLSQPLHHTKLPTYQLKANASHHPFRKPQKLIQLPNSLVPLRRVYRQPSARCAHIRLRQLSLLLINNRSSTSPTASFVDRNLVAMNHSENHHSPPYHHVVLRSDPVPFIKGLSYKFKFFLILVPFVFCF